MENCETISNREMKVFAFYNIMYTLEDIKARNYLIVFLLFLIIDHLFV